MKPQAVTIPDLGGAEDVEVIEVAVSEGDTVALEQTLITVESDKASMEIPAPFAGTVRGISVKVGDRVRMGDPILDIETGNGADAETAASAKGAEAEPEAQAETAEEAGAAKKEVEKGNAQRKPDRSGSAVGDSTPRSGAAADKSATAENGAAREIELTIPELGGAEQVEVIEVIASAGAEVEEGSPLLVLESDKASMELPSPAAGTVIALDVQVGMQVSAGQRIGRLRASTGGRAVAPAEPAPRDAAPAPEAPPDESSSAAAPDNAPEGDSATAITRVLEKEQRILAERPGSRQPRPGAAVYAGPAVRQLARELGVALGEVTGSGPRGRILKEDVQGFVKARLAQPARAQAALPALPEIDFSAFGPIETVALGNVQKAIVTNMQRSWLNVPHVTHFDLADVTDLEEFRAGLKAEMQRRDNKLTPLPFLLLAAARALREHPRFNSSLHPDGAQLVMKRYVHIGVAVDTPQGLVVPVIRDVDTKNVWDLAAEARELAEKARTRKLKIADMQGACFTISSLGNIGGEGFTPIVNAPEVAILGVSKLAVRPVWNGKEFLPRRTLPLSLSYDHRVINGADAGQFMGFLVEVLGDIRRLLL